MARRFGKKAPAVLCFSFAAFVTLGIFSVTAGHRALAGIDAEGCGKSSSWKTENVGGVFKCEVPVTWTAWRNTERESKGAGVYGIFLKGPRNIENRPPTIYLRYYSGSNSLFPDAKSYIARQLEPGPVALARERTTGLKSVTVAKLTGSRFLRNTFDYIPPHSLDTKEIKIREEYIVLTAEKGFFVFIYSSPKSLFKRYHPLFQHVLGTFEPLKERS